MCSRMGRFLVPDLIRKVHDYLTVCAPAPFQAAGVVALGLPEGYYASVRARYAANRKLLFAALDRAGLRYFVPQGAYYLMADFGSSGWRPEEGGVSGKTPDRLFAEYLAREVGVVVVPGSSFYAGEGQGLTRVRINFAKAEEAMREAARRLARIA